MQKDSEKTKTWNWMDIITTPKLEGVILHAPFQEPIDGTLCITGHHLILNTKKENVPELWLLIQCIDGIEKKHHSNNTSQKVSTIIIKCKDFKILQLDIPALYNFQNVYASIERLSNLDKPELMYAFFYRPMYTILEDGHTLFPPESEYAKLVSSEDWRISHLLIQCIDAIEKKHHSNNTSQKGGTIIIKCKDFKILQLDIPPLYDFQNVYASIERLSNLDKPELMYAFFYRPMYTILEDGHTLFPPESEYAKLVSSDDWRISHVNKNYAVCKSYSSVLVVPKSIDDSVILAAASFRDGGRFPVVSYKHENGAVLLRSSQPLLSNGNKRSRADEKILSAIRGTAKKGFIIDCRSANMVSHCKSKGGGSEPDGHYGQWNKIFKNLDKLVKCDGSVLEHFAKFIEACNDTTISSDKWLSKIESSHWLTHVLNVLSTACLVAQCLDIDGVSVLVHGSSGLDATLLVTSIAQVILNPDCRTVRGLQALIEREWIQAGHPFQTRQARFCFSNSKLKNHQPTFLLFLDCIQQLHYQFPYSFEFTTQFLILIFENSYYSNFGTFLANNEYERQELNIREKTMSFWSYLNRPEVITNFLNPLYEPNKTAIWPSIAPVSLVIWDELYLRWVTDQKYRRRASMKTQDLIENDKDLRTKVIRLRRQLLDLQKEVQNAKLVDGGDGLDEG